MPRGILKVKTNEESLACQYSASKCSSKSVAFKTDSLECSQRDSISPHASAQSSMNNIGPAGDKSLPCQQLKLTKCRARRRTAPHLTMRLANERGINVMDITRKTEHINREPYHIKAIEDQRKYEIRMEDIINDASQKMKSLSRLRLQSHAMMRGKRPQAKSSCNVPLCA